MDWVGQTHALGTSVARLGADSHTKIAKSETLLTQTRRLMSSSEPYMYPQWMPIHLLLGPYVRVDDALQWIGWAKHMPRALPWPGLGLIRTPKSQKVRPS